MNGFINESVSKLYDGFGSVFYLLALYFATRLVYLPVAHAFGKPGVFIYILFLLAVGIFMLARSLVTDKEETRLATYGLTAGVLLWHVMQFSNLMGNSGLFGQTGWLFWLLFLLIAIVLWRKVFLVGMRFFVLVYLLMWAGMLYVNTQNLLISWPPVLVATYHAVRVIALAGILVFLWWIVFRTFTPVQRKACAVGLAFCGLLAVMAF
jgi:hypothetical protein